MKKHIYSIVYFVVFSLSNVAFADIEAPFVSQSSIGKNNQQVVCADFTNIGTSNPKLLNSCDKLITVDVVNYDRNGVKVADRVFHLLNKETRPIEFPGYQMFIEWEKDWSSEGSDDGSQFLAPYQYKIGETVVWGVHNNSPDRYNAFQYIIYQNGRKFGTTFYVIPPGQTNARVYGFTPPDTGTLVLDWSRLDPK